LLGAGGRKARGWAEAGRARWAFGPNFKKMNFFKSNSFDMYSMNI
jgi:hypothetical protein